MRMIAFLILFTSFIYTSGFAFKDSVGLKTVDGKKYIMHQVEKSQGLFAISQRYGVSVDVIKAANGNIEVLALDQIILVPVPRVIMEEKKFNHTVEKGETLYKIARLYNVSVDNLKKWNDLQGDVIKEGMDLMVIQIVKYNEVEKPKQEVETKKEGGSPQDFRDEQKITDAEEVKEEGIATWIEDPSVNSRQALALHKKATPGTIIKVTNIMNNKEVYVKVVGNIPNSGQTNEIIRLSKFAAKQLKIKDQITRVKLSYYPEK